MNALPQGVEQGLGHLQELASWLGVGLLVLIIGLAVVPFILWWNTARTNRLLNQLLDEQEKTNVLLQTIVDRELVAQQTPEQPAEDQDHFTLS